MSDKAKPTQAEADAAMDELQRILVKAGIAEDTLPGMVDRFVTNLQNEFFDGMGSWGAPHKPHARPGSAEPKAKKS